MFTKVNPPIPPFSGLTKNRRYRNKNSGKASHITKKKLIWHLKIRAGIGGGGGRGAVMGCLLCLLCLLNQETDWGCITLIH